MPADDGLVLLRFAKDKEEEDLLFQRWLVAGQFEMSFEEFKQKLCPPQQKDDAVVLADVQNILTSWEVKQHGTI